MKNIGNTGHFKQFCVHGHDISVIGRDTAGHCKGCRQVYRDKNKEITKQKQKEFRQKHLKEMTERKKKAYQKHRKKILENKKRYYQDNKHVLNNKRTLRKLIDLNFKLACNLRGRLGIAIKTNQKKGSAIKDLGCSIEFFKEYIESKFYDNMTWTNWGSVWELDHIIPLCKFDLTDRDQFLKACHYTNLQPLTKPDHYKKTVNDRMK